MQYMHKIALFPKFSQKKRQLYGGYILTARISPCVFSSKLTKVYHKVMLIASTKLKTLRNLSDTSMNLSQLCAV